MENKKILLVKLVRCNTYDYFLADCSELYVAVSYIQTVFTKTGNGKYE